MSTLLDKWNLIARMAGDHRLSKGAEIRVAIVLLDHFNSGNGRCDPSVETIAKRTATTGRAVFRAIGNLVRFGYFAYERRGWHRSNTYIPNFAMSEVTPTSHLDASEVTPTSPQTASEVTPTSHREVTPTSHKHGKSKPVRKDEHGKEDVFPAPVTGTVVPIRPIEKPAAAKRQPKGRTNNLSVLENFQPSAEQLAKLRTEAPNVAHRLDNLLKRFKISEYSIKGFESGKYSDPARTFAEFVYREEGFALDRHPTAPTRGQDKPRTALIAGSPEVERFYDDV